MATRYKAILKFYGHDWAGDDLDGWTGAFTAKDADRILIATPTEQHFSDILKYRHFGKPILCEKPISTDMSLIECLEEVVGLEAPFEMVDQYRYLFDLEATGPTRYDYFRHGKDGLYWDCINIIKHAKADVHLNDQSPHWLCTINGHRLRLGSMDWGYSGMILDWLDRAGNDVPGIIAAHRKVDELCRQRS